MIRFLECFRVPYSEPRIGHKPASEIPVTRSSELRTGIRGDPAQPAKGFKKSRGLCGGNRSRPGYIALSLLQACYFSVTDPCFGRKISRQIISGVPMPQVQLDDQVFRVAQRRAADGGYSSVDEYVADVLAHDTMSDADDIDHLFTPARLAHIDAAEADIKSGKIFTTDQADDELAKRRAEWLRTHPR